jgi:hypothetical protein
MQLQPDGSVSTLNPLDAGLLPYTTINGSTFQSPDAALISQTPLPSDPQYAAEIVEFVRAVAPERILESTGLHFEHTRVQLLCGLQRPSWLLRPHSACSSTVT